MATTWTTKGAGDGENHIEYLLPVSALVVGLDEAPLLGDCLASLSFCAEKVYVDLGSRDESVKIASSMGWEVKLHERVPFVEIVHAEISGQLRFDWVLLLDPDERASVTTAAGISPFVTGAQESQVGAIRAPWDYYFKGKQILGTPWGNGNTRRFLVNRRRVTFSAVVHRGVEIQSGFHEQQLGTDYPRIQHFWSNSWRSLVVKHIRYLKSEGSSRYSAGRRTSLFTTLITPWKTLVDTILHKAPFRDGLTGVALSCLWVVYKSAAELALLLQQRRVNQNRAITAQGSGNRSLEVKTAVGDRRRAKGR